MKALTVLQPHASLIIGGLKPVENRTWPVPSTLPQWYLQGDTRWWPGPHSRPWAKRHGGVPDGPFPFRLAIHAGKRHDGNEFRKALIHATRLTGEGEPGNTMEWIRGWWANRDGIGGYGALIGTVLVTGCHHADDCRTSWPPFTRQMGPCSPWADTKHGVYHWTLADPVEFAEPIPMRGRQRLWTVPDAALDGVAA